jgi:Trp operon repressor
MITISKKTADIVAKLHGMGLSCRNIGRKMNMSHSYVSKITRGEYKLDTPPGEKQPKTKPYYFKPNQYRCWITGCGV